MTSFHFSSPMPPHTDPNHSRRWLVLAVIGVAQLMVILDATIVNIALPSAQQDLGFSDDSRQWIITAYALAFGSLLLLGGRVGDLFGRKWTFIGGLIGFSVASAIGGAAGSFGVLVAARAAAGRLRRDARAVGARAAGDDVHRSSRARQGVRHLRLDRRRRRRHRPAARRHPHRGALVALVPVRQPVIALPAAIFAFRLLVNQAHPQRPRIDVPGVLLATSGLFALVYGFSNSETHSWGHPVTIVMLTAAVVLLGAFVVVERRVAHPLLPLRIVADRTRGGAYAAIGLAGISMFALFLFLTYYMQRTLGFSPIQTGLGVPAAVGGDHRHRQHRQPAPAGARTARGRTWSSACCSARPRCSG